MFQLSNRTLWFFTPLTNWPLIYWKSSRVASKFFIKSIESMSHWIELTIRPIIKHCQLAPLYRQIFLVLVSLKLLHDPNGTVSSSKRKTPVSGALFDTYQTTYNTLNQVAQLDLLVSGQVTYFDIHGNHLQQVYSKIHG